MIKRQEISSTDKLYMLLTEYQNKRGDAAGQQPKEQRELMREYKAALKEVLDAMQTSITEKRAELLKADVMLGTLYRNLDDFIRYDTDPDARRGLARGIGSKRNLEKRGAITSKEQCFDVMSGGELTGERLRAFLEAVDA